MRKRMMKIEINEDYNFSVQEVHPFIENGNIKQMLPAEIAFVIEDVEVEDLQENNLIISLSKDEALKLSEYLRKLT